MKEQILLMGGGGHAVSVIDVIELEDKYSIAGIIDVKEKVGQEVLGYKIIGCDEDLQELFKTYKHMVITIGQIKTSAIRVKFFDKLNSGNSLRAVNIAICVYCISSIRPKYVSFDMFNAIICDGYDEAISISITQLCMPVCGSFT